MFQVASPYQTNEVHFHLIGCAPFFNLQNPLWKPYIYIFWWVTTRQQQWCPVDNLHSPTRLLDVAVPGAANCGRVPPQLPEAFTGKEAQQRKPSRNGWKLDGHFTNGCFFWIGCFVDGFLWKMVKICCNWLIWMFWTWKTVPDGMPPNRVLIGRLRFRSPQTFNEIWQDLRTVCLPWMVIACCDLCAGTIGVLDNKNRRCEARMWNL